MKKLQINNIRVSLDKPLSDHISFSCYTYSIYITYSNGKEYFIKSGLDRDAITRWFKEVFISASFTFETLDVPCES